MKTACSDHACTLSRFGASCSITCPVSRRALLGASGAGAGGTASRGEAAKEQAKRGFLYRTLVWLLACSPMLAGCGTLTGTVWSPASPTAAVTNASLAALGDEAVLLIELHDGHCCADWQVPLDADGWPETGLFRTAWAGRTVEELRRDSGAKRDAAALKVRSPRLDRPRLSDGHLAEHYELVDATERTFLLTPELIVVFYQWPNGQGSGSTQRLRHAILPRRLDRPSGPRAAATTRSLLLTPLTLAVDALVAPLRIAGIAYYYAIGEGELVQRGPTSPTPPQFFKR